MSRTVYLHSYSMRDAAFEEVVAAAKANGYDGIELHSSHFDPAKVEEGVARAVEIAKVAGLSIGCVDYSANLTVDDDGEREAAITTVMNTIDACAVHGIAMINGFAGWVVADPHNWSANGSAIANEDQYERAAEAYHRIAEHGTAANVRVCVEVHMNTIHDSFASTKKLINLAGHANLHATVDPGNTFAVDHAENDPGQMSILGDRIGYVHVKNCLKKSGYDYDIGLEYGDIDIAAWLSALDGFGYDGPICIEYCGDGDPAPFVQNDIKFLRAQVV